MTPCEVVVIGGGVQGASIAYHLTRAGARVTLLERWGIAAGASGASAGGVRHQGRDLREFPLAFRAIDRWLHLEQELNADLHYRREGHATTIEDGADLPSLQDSGEEQRAHGLDIYLVQGDELRHLIPGVAPSVIAVAYTPHDGHADPTLTTQAFANAAKRQGARVRSGVTVTAISISGGRATGVGTTDGAVAADAVVLAAGAWSMGLAAGIGLDLHCSPDAYQALTTQPMAPHLAQVLGSIRRTISLKQLPDGRYLLGGGWPGQFALNDPRGQVIEANVARNIAEAVAILPDVARAVVQEGWIGIDAHGHDEVPVLGPVDGIDGLVVATGFSGHGFALSPAVGEAIAGLITTGASPIDISRLSLDRFHGSASGASEVRDAG